MKLAAFDVGSNTVLMLVVECGAVEKPRVLADLSRITRLGRGVDASGRLNPESAVRTLDTIAEFADKARAMAADKIVGVATAALRDASDGVDFLARVKQRTGITLEIISGQTEAQLSYLSTRKGLRLSPADKLLIVDIGGGSTELIRAEPDHALEVVSLQIGSVRLTERIIHHDPPPASEAEILRAAIDKALCQLGWHYRPDKMVGIAGTVTTLCAIALGLERYSPESVHGYRLGAGEISRLIELLGSMPLEQRKQLPGMEPGRADVLFAGAEILERVMAYFGCRDVIVSDQGVRWGLMWREVERQTPPICA
ncbi:MAG: Ppx/GppA family phosphatase [Deltaproteobacteria bacterium]|nr:Ppx/GppA family phosphatase [Deltaproteobacteria bacterium]